MTSGHTCRVSCREIDVTTDVEICILYTLSLSLSLSLLHITVYNKLLVVVHQWRVQFDVQFTQIENEFGLPFNTVEPRRGKPYELSSPPTIIYT